VLTHRSPDAEIRACLSSRREERSPLLCGTDAPFPNGTEPERKKPISGQSARCVRLIISAIRYRSRAYANKPRAAGVKSGVIVRYAARGGFSRPRRAAPEAPRRIFSARVLAPEPLPPPSRPMDSRSEITGQACATWRLKIRAARVIARDRKNIARSIKR